MSEERLTADEQAALDAMRADDGELDQSTPAPGPAPQAPEPEQQTPDQSEGEPQQFAPKTVDIRALHEERARTKELREQIAAANQRMQTMEERTNLILQRVYAQPQPDQAAPVQPAIPDLSADPVGHIVATQQDLARRLDQITSAGQQQQQLTAQQQQQLAAINAVVTRAQALESQFRSVTPDYEQVTQWLAAQRHAELEAIGIDDPAERVSILQQQDLGIADRALRSGRNPAQVLYDTAKGRGYRASAAGNGSQQSADADAGQQTGQRLQQIAAGQQQSRTIGSMRGGAPPPLTAQRLIEMPLDEFHKLAQTAAGRALMGE